jgi:hypothetical protein
MSREAEIDKEMKLLIGKIVHGDATDEDRNKLTLLQMERSRLMTPEKITRRLARAPKRW